MNTVSFKLKVWWGRRLSYRLTWLLMICLSLGLTTWGTQRLSERISTLTPRLHDMGRQSVWLTLDRSHTQPEGLEQMKASLLGARYGVPVLQTQPSLKLIGTLEELKELDGALSARLGLYQRDFKALTTGALLRVQIEPPSLSLLLNELSTSARGRAAIQRLKEALSHLKAEARSLLSLLWSDLKSATPTDLLERIGRDPFVTARFERHFHEQLINQLPWGTLLSSTLESDEFEKIRATALEGIELRPILAEALRGTTEHALRSDSIWKGFKVKEFFKSVKRVGRNFTQKKDQSLDAGAQRAADQVLEGIKRNFEREQALLKQEGGKLLARQARAAHLERYVIKWVEAISQDEALLEHVKARYQPELISGVKRGLELFKGRSEVTRLISDSWERLSEAGLAFVQALIFDQNLDEPGPNPLLISVIEELIRGEQSPSVHLTPRPGAPIEAGHHFQEQAPNASAIGWLSRLIDLSITPEAP